jgi:hypothetical protein
MIRLGDKIRLTQSEYRELMLLIGDTPVTLYRAPTRVADYNQLLQSAADYWKHDVDDEDAHIVAEVIEETKILTEYFAAALLTG